MNQSGTTLFEITQENHSSTIMQEGFVVVKCWASHCRACKMLDPIYSRVSEMHRKHKFAELDTVAESELASLLGIVHVPSLLLYREGILIFKQAGNFDEASLNDIIGQAEALDMDSVRADIAAEHSEQRATQAAG